VDKVTGDRSFPLQKEFQEYLMKLCGRTDGLNKYFIAGVLRICRHQLAFVSQANIDDINRTHDIRDDDTRIDYGRLFRDSKLVVHMVFADKDAVRGHYTMAVKSFQRDDVPDRGGYRAIASTKQEDVLEKGDVRTVLVNALPRVHSVVSRGLRTVQVVPASMVHRWYTQCSD
jgi:hypothetical protein